MPTFRFLLRSTPALIGALFLACQGDDMPDLDGMGGQGGEGGASSTTEITRTLGQEGGELATSNTTLFVPSGALQKNTQLKVEDLDADEIEALPQTTEGVRLVGFPSKFTPHGLTFEQPVDVGLSYPPPEDEDTPIVAMKLDNDQDKTWEIIQGAEFESGKASFKIDGFSYYACFEDPNGVAEMLYGPDASGTGGSGAGGTGTGGDGSGGAGTGGEATGGNGTGGNGTGGASGGSGGAMGLNGYLDTPTFKGYGYTEVGTGASIDTDLASSPGPNCASGSTGATSDGNASLVYYVNQGTDNIELGPLLVPDSGIRLHLTQQDYQQYTVELRGEPGVWCTQVYTEGGNFHFLPWEEFSALSCPNSQTSDPFDPATDAIVKVAVTVTSNGEYVETFDYCIEELTTGLPNGYMSGPTWAGYGSVSHDGYSYLEDDLSEEPFPNCITGTTDVAGTAFAELSYNLNESVIGSGGPVTVQGTGLLMDLVSESPRDMQVRLVSNGLGTSFCAGLADVVTATYPLDWENDFVDCDTGSQFNPGNAPIDTIAVRVLSSGVVDDPYDLCIDRLEADIPIGQ